MPSSVPDHLVERLCTVEVAFSAVEGPFGISRCHFLAIIGWRTWLGKPEGMAASLLPLRGHGCFTMMLAHGMRRHLLFQSFIFAQVVQLPQLRPQEGSNR